VSLGVEKSKRETSPTNTRFLPGPSWGFKTQTEPQPVFLHFADGIPAPALLNFGMGFSPGKLLRWTGGLCLFIAILMVIIGQTLLHDRLRAEAFIYYWLICMLVTGLALILALLDFWLVRRRGRREQAALLKETLQTIIREGAQLDDDDEKSD
jgi:hypothetical protein